MRKIKIVFLGTPEFAVASLKILHQAGKEIVGVVTAPDRPAGRGRAVQTSAVKDYAELAGLNILQPTNLKSLEFLKELSDLEADLFVIVAFRMLPEAVWTMPGLGSFNLHASLLPDYRGAAPINWAIINGEKETGITTFFLKHAIDTGDIILQQKEPILPEDTVGTLYERLMLRGAQAVLETVEMLANGDVPTIAQKLPSKEKHAPKIFKETCQVDWSRTGSEVHDFVRGLSPYPAAWTELEGKTMKVFWGEPGSHRDLQPGEVYSDGKTLLLFGTADGSYSVTDLQLQGKKRMAVTDFLRGYTFKIDNQ